MFFMASANIEINPGVSTKTYHKDTSNACQRSPAKKKDNTNVNLSALQKKHENKNNKKKTQQKTDQN